MQPETRKLTNEFYPFGTQYYRAPTPLPDEWEMDLSELAKAGYTHVQYRPQWRWHERVRGQAAWNDLDTLFDLADKHGLKVILKPMLETAPDRVFEDLGGTRIGFHGIPIEPIAHGSFYVGGWLPCFDNPLVMEAARQFVRELVGRYMNHPALWFYDVWNEPRSRPLGQCQCSYSVESYRNWLQSRYQTIVNMNAALGKAWTSFDTLYPPASHEDYTELYLWRQWAAWAVSEHVRLISETIRSEHPESYLLVHVGSCSVAGDVAWDATDDLQNAKSTDSYGTSFPVNLHPQTPLQHGQSDYISDWIRRVDPSYWCHEFYPNHGGWCVPPEPQTLNRLIWMAIAGGASGFTFWQYRSERVGCETNGYGLREIDGSPTERSQVADKIAAIMRQHGSKLVGTMRERSSVAQVYSRTSDLISRIQAIESPDLWLESWNIDYAYKNANRSTHILYGQAGNTVDWVVPGDDLDGVSVLCITCAEILDASEAAWLTDYVCRGGNLIVEFPFACRDENTWVSRHRPGHDLHKLLGCLEKDRTIIGPQAKITASFINGMQLDAGGWKVELSPEGGEPIAEWSDGSIAAVRHRYGNGTVYSLGASLSLSFNDRWDDPSLGIARWLLDQAGGVYDHGEAEGVWVRRRRANDYEIWFVFNVTDSVQRMSLQSTPICIWQGSEYTQNDNILLPPGAAWVAEMVRLD